jgi:hypothetical protein
MRVHVQMNQRHFAGLRYPLVGLPLLVSLTALAARAQEGWWMREPIRWVQTNLCETDTSVDPGRLLYRIAEYRANVLHVGMGGIVAYYRQNVPFHCASTHLPPGKDLVGDIVRPAHPGLLRDVVNRMLPEHQILLETAIRYQKPNLQKPRSQTGSSFLLRANEMTMNHAQPTTEY